MEASKIVFSEAERRLIADAEIILTKNLAIDKIVELFGQLANKFRQISVPLQPQFPQLFSIHPKISRGEKHLGLPWVILDYPRYFDKTSGQLAIRTLFWWGHYFSIRLHASGIYFQPFVAALKESAKFKDWIYGITDNPWDLNLPNPGWADINSNTAKEIEGPVLVLAKKIPISEWESVKDFSKDYELLIDLLKNALGTEPVK